jgi:hypothetical protein
MIIGAYSHEFVKQYLGIIGALAGVFLIKVMHFYYIKNWHN